jgi:hypothetical protein
VSARVLHSENSVTREVLWWLIATLYLYTVEMFGMIFDSPKRYSLEVKCKCTVDENGRILGD